MFYSYRIPHLKKTKLISTSYNNQHTLVSDILYPGARAKKNPTTKTCKTPACPKILGLSPVYNAVWKAKDAIMLLLLHSP
jgi:hypothetical protein